MKHVKKFFEKKGGKTIIEGVNLIKVHYMHVWIYHS
jgi:hypothetical protein